MRKPVQNPSRGRPGTSSTCLCSSARGSGVREHPSPVRLPTAPEAAASPMKFTTPGLTSSWMFAFAQGVDEETGE